MHIVLAALIAAFVALNIFATWRALKCDEFSSSQKLMQAAIVWLIPLIGALVVLYFTHLMAPQDGVADAGEPDVVPGQIVRFNEGGDADDS